MNKINQSPPVFKQLHIIILLLILISACSNNSDTTASGSTITIFAASSLTETLTEISKAFENEHNTRVITSFGGSSTLATQIIEGAQVDIFASANPAQVQRLIDERLASAELIVFAHNQLIIITPASNPAGIDSPDDLADDGVKLILAAAGVPVREYTEQVIETLAEDDSYPVDYSSRVYRNVVSEEENVRQVLAKIVLGEADAAFVYQTDITPTVAQEVNTIALPPHINPPINYVLIMLDNAPEPVAAQRFFELLRSETGQCILARHQFVPINDTC